MSHERFLSIEEPQDYCRPERNLVRAVLERGIMDFLGMACRPSDRACAEKWIMRDDDVETAGDFSFFHCCEILGVDPIQARRRIAKIAMLPKTSLVANFSFDAHVRIAQYREEAMKDHTPLPLHYSPGGGKLRGLTQLSMLNEKLTPTIEAPKEERTTSLATDMKNPRRALLPRKIKSRRLGRFAKFQEEHQLRRRDLAG